MPQDNLKRDFLFRCFQISFRSKSLGSSLVTSLSFGGVGGDIGFTSLLGRFSAVTFFDDLSSHFDIFYFKLLTKASFSSETSLSIVFSPSNIVPQ